MLLDEKCYDEKCYVISIHTHKVERLHRRSAGKGGLRMPMAMHMRHMQPHTHRRKPHTP